MPVLQWTVGRKVNGQPADIGAVVANWGTHNQNIIVNVGTDPLNYPCANANILRLDEDASSSSIFMDLKGNLYGQAYCEANAGVGGRISGTVTGQTSWISGESIGIGEGACPGGNCPAARLQTGPLELVEIKQLPVNSVIAAASAEEIAIAQGSAGDIRIDGNLSGKLTIGGDMSGDIIADWDADGEGLISGKVTISGNFSGDICDAEMGATLQAPCSFSDPACKIYVTGYHNTSTICAARTSVKFKTLPHSAPKNRILSINTTSTYGHEVALKIDLTSMRRCTGDYDQR